MSIEYDWDDWGANPECPKVGYHHSINHCACNPNYGRKGYCQICLRKIINFTVTNDWPTRKYHKKCWKEALPRNTYKCEECGFMCNELTQKFCNCEWATEGDEEE